MQHGIKEIFKESRDVGLRRGVHRRLSLDGTIVCYLLRVFLAYGPIHCFGANVYYGNQGQARLFPTPHVEFRNSDPPDMGGVSNTVLSYKHRTNSHIKPNARDK